MNKIKGGFYGVAIGDALGATVEFMSQQDIQEKYGTHTEIIGGGWLNLKPGEWTDDTEMTLAVADGIRANAQNPIPHIGESFLQWRATNPPDIGGTIRGAFHAYDRLGDWNNAAKEVHKRTGKTAGNGALMRTLPVVLAYKTPEEIYRKAIEIAKMTHWDIRAGLTCAFYCLLVKGFLTESFSRGEAIAMAMRKASDLTGLYYPGDMRVWVEIEEAIYNNKKLKPTGYTVDSLACALWAFTHHETLEDTIIAAVNLGGDADTIGAIAGGLAGTYCGYDAIPERWIEKFKIGQRSRLDKTAEWFYSCSQQWKKEMASSNP